MEQWKVENEGSGDLSTQDQPQLVVQQFSMEALHHIMLKNSHQILVMYNEMSVMYSQLDAYKHSGSRLDCSTLLDLYNGGSWSRKRIKVSPCKKYEKLHLTCAVLSSPPW